MSKKKSDIAHIFYIKEAVQFGKIRWKNNS